jgi:hypothetical protein
MAFFFFFQTTEAKGYDPKVFATATKDEGKKACVFTNYIRAHEDEDKSGQTHPPSVKAYLFNCLSRSKQQAPRL